jgi:hypothetical protein
MGGVLSHSICGVTGFLLSSEGGVLFFCYTYRYLPWEILSVERTRGRTGINRFRERMQDRRSSIQQLLLEAVQTDRQVMRRLRWITNAQQRIARRKLWLKAYQEHADALEDIYAKAKDVAEELRPRRKA